MQSLPNVFYIHYKYSCEQKQFFFLLKAINLQLIPHDSKATVFTMFEHGDALNAGQPPPLSSIT